MSGRLPIGPFDAVLRQPLLLECEVEGLRVTGASLSRMEPGGHGYEVSFEGVTPGEGASLASRACARSGVHHAMAFCMAVEDALGVEVPSSHAAARIALSEWARVASHLEVVSDLGRALEDDLVYARPRRYLEAVRAGFEEACGNAFGFGSVVPGGVEIARREGLERLEEVAGPLVREARTWSRKLRLSRGRLSGGVLELDEDHWPATAFRASGSTLDMRSGAESSDPYRETGYRPRVRAGGTALDRAEVMLAEITASIDLAGRVRGSLPKEEGAPALKYGSGSGVGSAESPHGGLEYTVLLGSEGRVVRAMRASAASQVLNCAGRGLEGIMYEDAACQLVTFNLCESCAAGAPGRLTRRGEP